MVSARSRSGRPSESAMRGPPALTHEVQACLASLARGDGLHANDNVVSSIAERSDGRGVNGFRRHKAGDLEVAWSGVELMKGVKQREGAGEVGVGSEESDKGVGKVWIGGRGRIVHERLRHID